MDIEDEQRGYDGEDDEDGNVSLCSLRNLRTHITTHLARWFSHLL
jgi:hypothetical protein